MSIEYKQGNPLDYSDKKIDVYFEIVSKELAKQALMSSGYISEINEKELGLIVSIARQEIPEILRILLNENIAVYAVVPGKEK